MAFPRIESIDDPEDPRVAPYRHLPRLDSRVPAGLFVAEGSLVVRRLLAGGRFRLRSILVTGATLPALRDLFARGPEAPLVYVAGAGVLRAIVGYKFHRGCIALGERGVLTRVEPLVAPLGPRRLVVLERVSDPDNVGAILRNAMGLGVQAVLLSPGSADPLSRKAIRVSAGAALCLPWARIADWPAELERLRAAGYSLVALTPDEDALDLVDVARSGAMPSRMALLLGAEGPGLSPGVRAAADLRVRIAMAPGLDSLNVAVASAITLHRLRG
ncbi:MAG: RNA methyltransferase [Candidatus Rokubacteria bacterium]|nr:RNA methyltransferase [Candidatus Rokubacteria bacterium]MBI3104387.1 RNA methyltransferase [Candidatus Rokubacteria bacterium]